MRRLTISSVASSVLVLASLLGCRGVDRGEGSPDAAVAPPSVSRARMVEARRLARPDAVWSAVLAPHEALRAGSGAFVGAFVDKGFEDAAGGVPMAFGARLSSFADGAIEVRAGDALATLHVRSAKSVEGALVDGAVVYEGAHPATDLVVGSAPGRVEAFWLLRDDSAPTTFALGLELAGLAARIEDGAVLLADAEGTTRMRIPRPSAVDGRGRRRDATLSFDGSTLTIAIDTSELAYPILLDPALEQVVWTSHGPDVPAWPPPGGTGYPRVTVVDGLQRTGGTARAGNGLVYLFGGVTIGGDPSTLLTPLVTQLLEWNGTSWAASAGGNFPSSLVLGDPSNGPIDRVADIAWDPNRKKLVMFGGFTMGPSGPHLGVWEYDPIGTKAWSSQCPDGGTCYASTPAVSGTPSPPSAVWAFNKVILVHQAGTFEWDPTAKVLKKFAATPDLARAGAALAFDAARNRLVAYGDTTGLSDTWETNGTTWTRVSTTGPLGVKNASLAYHAGRKRVVLWASTSTTGGLWTWDGAAWTAVTLSGAGPTLRPNAAFAYDDTRGKLLLTGGGTGGEGYAGNCFDSPYAWPYDSNRDYRTCARIDTWSSSLFGGACATSADCGVGTTCVDSVCCKTACTGSCQRCDLAGSVGTCVSVLSAEDPGTCSGASACDASGVCRKKQGQTCALGTDCLSGNCADGYCCNNACPGACESCNQAGSAGTCTPLPKGSSGKGCGLNTCSGTAGTCSTTCATDSDCATNAFCGSSGACVALLAKGGACERNRQCTTGVCADSVCCDSACSGACDACSVARGATTNGTCTILPASASPLECGPARCSGTSGACGTTCSVDSDCSSSGFCSGGTCIALRKKGESCERTSQCGSGLTCADGVCCNEACDGACRACSALNKESGDKSGDCGPAKEGTNPGAKCVRSSVTTCGASGFCNAAGSCAVYAAGTPCGSSGTTTCDGESVKGQTCDGLGACILDTAGTPCTPGRCLDGACKTTCATDADCAADGYCTGGACKKKSAPGAKCSIDAQCTSGFCADGVCCNARCDRSCEACDQAGTEGTCTAVTGKPRLGHPACAAGEPGNPCTAAACDGIDRATCAKKAGADVACREGSCEAGVESLPTSCDGSGSCPPAETRPCQPFACGADACKKSCATDADCRAGFVCNASTGACGAGDKCVGSIVTKVDGTTVDCAPYVCESSGRCKDTCATTADCVAPRICNGATCVDPSAPVAEEGGGCATSAPGSVGRGAAMLSLVALVGALRRRRARP